MNTDIRMPDEYEDMLIVYFKDGEAKVSSFYSKAEVIRPRKMAEEAIKRLQGGLDNGLHSDNKE